MIVVLLGETSSGKDFFMKRLLQELPSLNRVVTYTSRPPRKEEKDEVDYYFVSKEKMLDMIAHNELLEHTVYNTIHGEWIYGTHVNSFQQRAKDHLCILDYEGYKRVKKMYADEVVGILFHRDYEARKASYLTRGGDLEEFLRRNKDDREKFLEAANDNDLYHVVNDFNRTDEIIKMLKCIISLGGENYEI